MSHLRDFGLISTSLWQSERFIALEALDARLAYIWLHTGQKTCAGVMRVGPAHLFEEVDYVRCIERAEQIFDELTAVELIIWQRPYTIISKFLRHNPVTSYKHAIGAFKEVLAMPDCVAKTRLMSDLQKSRGAKALADWRNKNGDPHEVVFDIHTYLSEQTDPLETPSEPHGNPSGISRSKIYNGERRKDNAPDSDLPSSKPDHQAQPMELQRMGEGPTASLMSSRLAKGEA